MTEWNRLTEEPFFSEDGSLVTVIGNTAEMNAMGNALANGLGDNLGGHTAGQMRGLYAEMAREGRIQIAQVNAPTGELVAVARLYVQNPESEPRAAVRFLRGHNNVDISADSTAGVALASYLDAVNSGRVAMSVFGARGFTAVQVEEQAVEPAAPVQPLTPYQAAMQAAAQYNETAPEGARISAVQALSMGLGRVNAPAALAFEEVEPEVEQSWEVPVESRNYADGVKIVPVNSVSALKRIGGELENHYFLPTMPMKASEGERYARLGGYIICAVKKNGADEAMAEYSVQNGSIVLRALTGYEGKNITTGPLARAAVTFARELTLGVEGQTLFPNGNKLGAADAELELTNEQAAIPHTQPMIRSMVAPAYVENNGGYDDDEADEEEEEEEEEDEVEQHNEVVNELKWQALREEPYESDNGLRIVFVDSVEGLTEIGNAMDNPLNDRGTANRYAHNAINGEMQHYAVYDGTDMVGCGSMVVSGGDLACFGRHAGFEVKPFGKEGADATARINIAVSELVSLVNRQEVDVDVELTDEGFEFEESNNGYGR